MSSGGYVVRYVKDSLGKQSCIRLHRVITDAPDNLVVDHINHNTLDNTKNNLRLASVAQNGGNRQANSTSKTSKYKGVKDTNCATHSRIKKWRANIQFHKKIISCGFYYTELCAALAYNKKASELFGEFACLNKLPISEQEILKHEQMSEQKSINNKLQEKTSKYKGVYFHSERQVFIARLFDGRKLVAYAEDKDEDRAYNKLQQKIREMIA